MMTASDLLDVHLSDATPAQRERVTALIREISGLSRAAKGKLASELLAIAIDPAEGPLRRVQAARTLGHQAKRLEILGATSIAEAAVSALRDQFFRSSTNDISAAGGLAGLVGMEGMGEFLFQYLVYIVFVTDGVLGTQLLGYATEAVEGTELSVKVRALWERAQEERAEL
jgi:hypothetical protein